jgi:CRP-like cAMP-binding protein
MAGKTPLLAQLTDELGGLCSALHRTLADNHVTAQEAAELVDMVEQAHVKAQLCDIAQRDGLSRVRYGEPSRDSTREMAQLDTLRLTKQLRGRTRKSA